MCEVTRNVKKQETGTITKFHVADGRAWTKFEVEFILRWGEYFNCIYACIEADEVDRVEINGKIGN